MSNCAMSNETDLDWLARNVHKWPTHTPKVIPAGDAVFELGATFYSESVDVELAGGNTEIIERDDWLARRAELQTKPSWKDAPEWAEWIAQDDDGEWKWLAGLPGKYVDGWTAVKIKGCCKGLVLGDWRDTLERRPDMYKSEPKIDTSAEHVQKTAESMRDWFERGELPPVGVECEVMHRERWVVCDVIAHFQQKAAMVAAYTVDNGNALKQLDSCIAKYFRPIRTERDVLLSVIVEEMNRYDTDGKLADAILAAGFSLRDK